MVFFNYATMQMAAKIVYYGPGLCGKTTNLHHIYTKTSPQSRGEMVSLETETDRTLFFDLLPIDVGVIGGFKTRLQLYTVPGQVFYNTTRKLVLKGVDGIVFVADSQTAMLDANAESLRNLRENLAEIGLDLDEIPTVLQLNKRDLPNIAAVETMLDVLDPQRRFEHVESVASAGAGVFETLKMISKLTLRTLRRRMTGDEPARPAPPARVAQFRVQENAPSPARTLTATPTPTPAPTPSPTPAIAPSIAASASSSPTFVQAAAATATTTMTEPVTAPLPVAPPMPAPPMPAPVEDAFDPEATVAATTIDRRILFDVPVAEPPAQHEELETTIDAAPEPEPEPFAAEPELTPPPPPATPEPPPAPLLSLDDLVAPPFGAAAPLAPDVIAPPSVPEPDIRFAETEKPQKAEPDVKTVKVRSSVDVMAELEALRKRATQTTTPKPPKRDVLAELSALQPRRDIVRTLHLQVPPDVLPRAKSVRVTLTFEDEGQGVVRTDDQTVDLGDTANVQSLSVNLKIDLT